MTFEEFLIKKKINPDQLQHADQDFFDEFKSHFNEMGEKSFDHSKKFWFNKLRRAHPLPEEVKIPVAEVKTVAEALEAKAKPAFKPRFKANIGVKEEVKNDQGDNKETADSESTKPIDTAKPAYKPRFKAPAKPADKSENKEEQIEPQEEIVEPKPAYRPRFKAGDGKKDEG